MQSSLNSANLRNDVKSIGKWFLELLAQKLQKFDIMVLPGKW